MKNCTAFFLAAIAAAPSFAQFAPLDESDLSSCLPVIEESRQRLLKETELACESAKQRGTTIDPSVLNARCTRNRYGKVTPNATDYASELLRQVNSNKDRKELLSDSRLDKRTGDNYVDFQCVAQLRITKAGQRNASSGAPPGASCVEAKTVGTGTFGANTSTVLMEIHNKCSEPQLVYVKFKLKGGFPFSVNGATWYPVGGDNPSWGSVVPVPKFPWSRDSNDSQLQIFVIQGNTTARGEVIPTPGYQAQDISWNAPLSCKAGGDGKTPVQRMFVSVDGEKSVCHPIPRNR